MSTEDTSVSTETTETQVTEDQVPKTLDEFKASFRNAVKKAGEKEGDGKDPKAAETAATTEETSATEKEVTESVSDAGKKDGSPADHTAEVADGLARIAELERKQAAKAEKRKADLEKRQKELDERAKSYEGLDPIRTAREKVAAAKAKIAAAATPEEIAAARKEKAAAALELLGAELDIEDIGQLSELAGATPTPVSLEDVKREAAREALETFKRQQEEAATKKAEEEKAAVAELTRKELAKVTNEAAPWLDENAAKFPAFKARPVRPEEVTKLMREGYEANARAGSPGLPSWEDIFTYLHEQRLEAIRKDADAVGLLKVAPATEPAKPPMKTVSASDKRGAVTATEADNKPKKLTYAEEKQRLRQIIREAGAAK